MDGWDIAFGCAAVVMGSGIAFIWTRDIVSGTGFESERGLVFARSDAGDLMVFHWIAEFTTAALLVIGGVGLITGTTWATVTTAIGAGALAYTSVNSLGWALADPERSPYAVPMYAGLAISLSLAAYLFVR